MFQEKGLIGFILTCESLKRNRRYCQVAFGWFNAIMAEKMFQFYNVGAGGQTPASNHRGFLGSWDPTVTAGYSVGESYKEYWDI